MIKVIYAGLVVASGGADLTIWLLFGFVVCFFCSESICKTREQTHRYTVCCRKYSSSLCVILIQIKSLNVPFRCRTWYLQQQKHIGGTFRSSEVTQEIGVPLFHSYTKQMGYSLYICDLSVKLNECSDHPLICRA